MKHCNAERSSLRRLVRSVTTLILLALFAGCASSVKSNHLEYAITESVSNPAGPVKVEFRNLNNSSPKGWLSIQNETSGYLELNLASIKGIFNQDSYELLPPDQDPRMGFSWSSQIVLSDSDTLIGTYTYNFGQNKTLGARTLGFVESNSSSVSIKNPTSVLIPPKARHTLAIVDPLKLISEIYTIQSERKLRNIEFARSCKKFSDYLDASPRDTVGWCLSSDQKKIIACKKFFGNENAPKCFEEFKNVLDDHLKLLQKKLSGAKVHISVLTRGVNERDWTPWSLSFVPEAAYDTELHFTSDGFYRTERRLYLDTSKLNLNHYQEIIHSDLVKASGLDRGGVNLENGKP